MYLKKVEVKGFKSFANKLELDFNQGITTIVGPNGSGKSNIVDAIRWVLGEQSMKTLRGAKTEEVIFAGTSTKKALGFAEVSLYMDNSTKLFNSEYEEVKITRCLYRSGESEYKINDSTCRLKDIYDVFLNTGIGKEGYSIIGQGKIDEILSAKPKERRSFFEEATGISKSRLDLNETNKKLEEEKANLLRVNDIISEIETQIEPLHMQSEKASLYLQYKEELKRFEINLFIMDIERYKVDFEQIQMRYNSLVMEVEEKSENITYIQEEKKELQGIITNIRKNIELKNNELNNAEMKLEQMKHDKVLIAEKINSSKKSIESKNESIHKQTNMILAKKKMIENDEEKYNSVISELESKRSYYKKEEETYLKSNQIIEDKEAEIESKKAKVVDMMNQTHSIKSEILGYNSKIENYEENKEQITKQNEEVENVIDSLKKEKEEFQEEKAFKKEELLKQEAIVKKMQEEVQEENSRREKLDINKIEKEKKIKALSSKLEVLEVMEKNFEGYNKGVKEVLAAANKGSLKGIIGTVSELIKVNKEYEVAMQIAFGARLQNIVVEDDKSAKDAIRYLKQNKCGRATFMPLSAATLSKDYDFSKALSEKGAIDNASNLFEIDEKYAKVVKGLVKNILIVDDIDNATAISNKYKYSINIVTQSGEQVSTNGSMTGGEYKSQINLLSRAREIEELKKELSKLLAEVENDKKEIESLASKINTIEIAIVDELDKKQEISIDILKLEEKINSYIKEIDKYNSDIADDRSQVAYYDTQKSMFKELIEEKEKELEELNQNIKKTNDDILKAKEVVDVEKGIRDIKNEELVELKVAISTLDKERALHDDTLRGVNDEIKMLEDEKAASLKLIDVYNKEIDEFKKIIFEIENDNAHEIELRDKLKKEYDVLKIDLNINEEKQLKNEELQEKFQKEKDELSQSLYKEENTLNGVTIKLENIRQKLADNYSLSYEDAKEYKDVEMTQKEAETKSREYKSKISSLGNVNVDAIEQYKEMEKRYDFLKGQRDDIINAEAQLEVLINHLLSEMRTKFSDNLKDINEKFDMVFKELFGGGHSYVELTESDDVLEAGIEIIVSPPGKKVQNLSLLSGGERALVAIALLFGILDLKPSPFCILDEIEAALDEANVTRFAEYIRKLSSKIQFLVITHRSGTMEVADYMYGVTMEEKGISKVVSLELGNTDYANDSIDDENK